MQNRNGYNHGFSDNEHNRIVVIIMMSTMTKAHKENIIIIYNVQCDHNSESGPDKFDKL